MLVTASGFAQTDEPGGWPGQSVDAAPDVAADPEAGEKASDEALIDATRRAVFDIVNNTTRWFDGFFGSPDYNVEGGERVDVSRGLLAIGTRWDERDGFDTRGRLRAQIPLPALERRMRLLLGRGDMQDIVDGSETDTIDTLPQQFSDFKDDDWLLGVGYRQDGSLEKGLAFGAGVITRSSDIDPFARVSYHYNKTYGERWLWRLRPRIFWQESREAGLSLSSILDRILNERWLIRSWITLITEDAVEGMGWSTDFIAYHSLDDNNALSYRIYASGETDNEVALQDYGLKLTYRRRFLREWLFLELSTGLSWPREFVFEDRDAIPSAGLELEMQFGDWPSREQR